MFNDVHTFEVVLTDVCVKQLTVKLQGWMITDVQFEGGCEANLRKLRNNLIGENLQNVFMVIQNDLCPLTNNPCKESLKKHLNGWFSIFADKLREEERKG